MATSVDLVKKKISVARDYWEVLVATIAHLVLNNNKKV